MANTLILLNIHYVFSTKNRQKMIDKSIRKRLWAYVGGIARENKMIAQAVGGTSDHIHVLITIPSSMSPSKAIQLIKAGSSKWIHDEFPEISGFAWQAGYGAFSVSYGKLSNAIEYINNQEKHHLHRSFEEEYLEFLRTQGIDFDERYLWG